MIRRIFAVLLALVVVIIIVGFLLPRQVTVERSVVIDQPADVIFDVLNDFRHFGQWSPWHARNPDAGYRVEGPPTGRGATLVWSDEGGSGAGRLWIVDTDRPWHIDMRLELGEVESESFFRIEPEGLAQRVYWGMRMEFGAFDLTGRYIGLMLPGLIGRSYQDGLERLVEYLDTTPGSVPELPAEFADQPPDDDVWRD